MKFNTIIVIYLLVFCTFEIWSKDKNTIEFTGTIINQDGEKILPDMLKITKKRYNSSLRKDEVEEEINKYCGAEVFYRYSKWDSVNFTFIKKGYKSVTVKFSAADKKIAERKNDVKIVLKKIGAPETQKRTEVVLSPKDAAEIKKIQKVIRELHKRPLKFSGVVTDEKGNLLRNVKVEIEKLKIDWIVGKDNRTSSVENVNGKFLFKYTGYDSVKFTFAKDGYFQIKKSLSLMNNNIGSIKEDVKIVLCKIGELPKKLVKGKTDLSWKKKMGGKITRTGWIYGKKDQDGYVVENVAFTKTKMVDFYIEKGKKGNSVFLNASSPDSGFICVSDAENFTYLKTAPPNGYRQKVEILQKRIVIPDYFFFKLNGKMYGKIEVFPPTIVEGGYNLSIYYYINPSGSRNLTTLEDE